MFDSRKHALSSIIAHHNILKKRSGAIDDSASLLFKNFSADF
jgi:hypothetical protein